MAHSESLPSPAAGDNSNGLKGPQPPEAIRGSAHDCTSQSLPNGIPPPARTAPLIEPEEDDTIHVASGGPLVVPREEISDLDDGEEFDLMAAQPMKIRKPHRREFIALKRDSEWTTTLLINKPMGQAMDPEYYYVDQRLRGPILDELKGVRVFLCFSFTAGTFFLWVVNVTPGNSWYESVILHAAKNEAGSNVWKLWVINEFRAARCSVGIFARQPSMAA